MLNTNKIQINSDGNIILQNIHGSTITIHKGDDANAIMGKLSQLHDTQLDALQQIIGQQAERFSDLLKDALKQAITQKNIVSNSTLTVGRDVHIGDKIIYNIQYPTKLEHSGSGDNVAGNKIVNIIQPATALPPELSINIPKTEDLSKIIGRAQDLRQVRDLLQEKQKVVVVNGLGGIGKTTLAQAYLTQYASEYAHILWLGQSEGDKFVLDLITAPGLTLNLGIDTDGKDAQTLFTEIVAKLKSIHAEKPCLWVIDNANAFLSKYFDYLPKPPQWHVLATSREKMPRFFVKDLDFLGEDDAVLLFHQHCGRITDEASIRSVLKIIDYHTLTIEILAKTAQRHDTLLATLQYAIEHDLAAGVYIPHKGDKVERVTSYLLSIFDLATLSAEEQRLLQHFAALPAEYISYPLLKKLIPETETNIAATLQDLSDKGWLLYANDPEAYKMHLIIAEVVKRKMPPSIADLQGLIGNVANLLSIDQTKDNPIDKFPFITTLGEAVLRLFPDASDVGISELQNDLGLILKISGNYAAAKALLEKAMHSDEANFGNKHINTATRYANLALVLKDIGDYKEARNFAEKAIDIYKVSFGENHTETAKIYSTLAIILKALGDYAGAKDLLEKVMRINEFNFGENDPNTARSYSNLATVFQDLGEYEGAKYLLEKALRSDELNFSKNHPNIAVRQSNLATVLQSLGDYAGAKDLLEKAVHSDEINFGENHPNTATRYSNLALVLQDLNDYIGAKDLLEKVVIINESSLGANHPTTAKSYSNLATVLQNLGDYEAAKTLFKKAMFIDEANFSENNPITAGRYFKLAALYVTLNEYKNAFMYIQKTCGAYIKCLGIEHPNTKNALNWSNHIKNKMLENGWSQAQINELSNG